MFDELTFEDEINFDPIRVPRAALRYAQAIAYPDLDVADYLDRILELAEDAQEDIPQGAQARVRGEALAEYLFQQLGYKGDTETYSDPRNSYLNEVIERNLGIPITLSVLYIAVAEELNIPARGVGLPGHFIVRVEDQDGPIYLDPFNGGVRLSVTDCAELVQKTTGFQDAFKPEWLEPASPLDILSRMLSNLRNAYVQRKAWTRALAVVEHLRTVQPYKVEHLRDMGLILHQHGSLRQAIDMMEKYLLRMPEAPDAEVVRRDLQAAAQELAQRN